MLDHVFTNPYLLTVAVALPLLASLLSWGLGASRPQAGRIVGAGASWLSLLVLSIAAFRLAPETGLQLGDRLSFWPDLGIDFSLAADGLSLPFAILAAALGAVSVSATRRPGELALALLAQAIALLVFLSQDLFVFLAASWTLPMVISAMIVGWGGEHAEYAATKFLAMILTGAALLTVSLVAISLVGNAAGSMTALWVAKPGFPLAHLNHWVLAGILASLWVAAPLFPFHNWLADVFESAPPSALPLVMGGIQAGAAYAFVRLALGFFPSYVQDWLPWLLGLGLFTALYSLLTTWGQPSLMRGLAFLGLSLTGIAYAGLGALMGSETSSVLLRALLLMLVATGLGALLVWLSAELMRRMPPLEISLPRLGFLFPRAATWWKGIALVALLLMGVTGLALWLAVLAGTSIGPTFGLGLALLAFLATAGTALARTLVHPGTPARVDDAEDLSPWTLALGWGPMLLAAIPMIWLILGSRALAIFSTHLGMHFVR